MHDAPVGRQRQQLVQELTAVLQFGRRLQQRDEPDAGLRSGDVDEAGLAGQDDRGQDVVDATGHRDDVRLDRLVTEVLVDVADRAEHVERLARAVGQAVVDPGQRPAAG